MDLGAAESSQESASSLAHKGLSRLDGEQVLRLMSSADTLTPASLVRWAQTPGMLDYYYPKSTNPGNGTEPSPLLIRVRDDMNYKWTAPVTKAITAN